MVGRRLLFFGDVLVEDCDSKAEHDENTNGKRTKRQQEHGDQGHGVNARAELQNATQTRKCAGERSKKCFCLHPLRRVH